MRPYSFDEFFATNLEESISPFLTPSSRTWGKNIALKSALLAGALLATSYFVHSPFLLLLVYFLVGTPALINSLHDLLSFEINIDVLMTLAAFLSVVIGSEREGALLLVLFELSAALENMVANKTRSSVLNLHKLFPRFATVTTADGHTLEKSIAEVQVGEELLVKAGEIVPLDGDVTAGRSFVNLVHLTGESEPLAKTVGDEVAAGAGNLDGTLTVRVKRTSTDSTLSRIIALITKAQEGKPVVEQFLDRFGKRYATTIILLSFAFALFLPLPFLGPEGSIYRALTFLIAASPCALVLATPTAYLSALSSCAKKGILPKGGVTLDGVAKCSTIALDKTGTLTTGKLKCSSYEHLFGPPNDQAVAIAASLEKHAHHPIAEAILELKAPQLPVENFRAIPGYGLSGVVAGKQAFIGHRDFIEKEAKQPIPFSEKMATYLLVEDSLYVFHFTDTLRPDAAGVIERLKSQNLRLIMLTGDRLSSAKIVADAVGITEVYADLKPEDKLDKITSLTNKAPLIMVGDGINDAPALARSTVGISMGKIGSATAVDASDIVFINDDISLLDWLYQKAGQTRRILKQNLGLALSVIVFATTPALLGLVPLWAAVILHEGGTVLVGLNSLRLLRTK
jgi:heavy metal translocating P-type ATPase